MGGTSQFFGEWGGSPPVPPPGETLPKYNGNIDGGLPSKRYNKATRCFHGVFKKRLNSLDVFRHSVERPHKTCTTQLVSSVVFEHSYFIGSSKQNSEKEFNDLLVRPAILCLI